MWNRRLRRMLGRPAVLASVLCLAACAVTSTAVREEAGEPLPFPELKADPTAHIGRTVILGGYVLEVRNTKDLTTLVLLQSPLGTGEEPWPRETSEGRFLVTHNGFLDPAVFSQGRKVTVAGTVTGVTRETVDERPYDYPALALREIHLWEDDPPYPQPYPHYYDPFYDPWWPYPGTWRHPYRRYHR